MQEKSNKKITTLCLVHQHPNILLGKKKRGFGAGCWNGFGGKVQEGETIEEAAKRELREEAGIEALDMEAAGVIDFEFQDGNPTIQVNIFRVRDYSGEPVETEEMEPRWFAVDQIPFKDMWRDDVYWMPLFLKGKRFTGTFVFDRMSSTEYQSEIVSHDLKVE